MECSLAALIACFSWSNLYVDAQVSYQDRSVPYHEWAYAGTSTSAGGLVETTYRSTISNENESPYMRNAIGFKLPFRKVDVYVDLYFHESSMSSKKDRGVNGYPAIRAQWFPFR
jgi:hypothetical protein